MNVSRNWIENNYKVYPNGQLYFIGLPIVTVKTKNEEELVLDWIESACNTPKKFNQNHPIKAMKKLREKVKNRQCFKEGVYYQEKINLIKRCDSLNYNNKREFHCLTLGREDREKFLTFTAREILNSCAEFKLGRPIEYIIENYTFFSDLFRDSQRLYDDLELLHYAWGIGKLDSALSWICDTSKVEGGFVDHLDDEDDIILNEYIEKFI